MIQLPKDPEEEWVEQECTISQLLERLAVVAPDMVKIEPDSEIVYVYRRESWRKATKIGQIDPDLLFGAACEKIEAEGLLHQHMYSNGSWRFRIAVNNEWIQVDSRESLTHAALQALLAALEGRQEECPECEGEGTVTNTYGMQRKLHCPECQGSDKKQEVKA